MAVFRHFYLREYAAHLDNANLSAKAKASIMLSKSEHTIDAYESDWNDFMDWCEYHDKTEFPPKVETIVNYLNDLADFAKANTISRRLSALSENLIAAGIADNPCASPLIRSTMRGIRRQKGTYQQGKTPLLLMDIEDIIAQMDDLVAPELVKTRDKAILLVGFMGAFRRSELVSIEVHHIHFSSRGMEIFIPDSKSDQEGEGNVIAIPIIDRTEVCAVRALRNWLHAAQITKGPVFRGFKKNGEVRATPLSDRFVSEIVKQYVSLIGLDPAMYGAHSLRHGFATTAASYGVEERNIMRQTRHKSVNMVRRYINEANRFVDNPINSIFKTSKNR